MGAFNVSLGHRTNIHSSSGRYERDADPIGLPSSYRQNRPCVYEPISSLSTIIFLISDSLYHRVVLASKKCDVLGERR
jgi:hypothetical protein